MIVGKWNEEIKDYEPYVIPDNWYVSTINTKFGWHDTVNCASCGRELEYGNCFPSRYLCLSPRLDLSLGVCSSCHDKEWGRA